MAKITGPLLSQEARGSIGPRLTFSVRKSGQQARFQSPQKDVVTVKRTVQREKFSLGLDLWRSLPDNEKYYWNVLLKNGEVDI